MKSLIIVVLLFISPITLAEVPETTLVKVINYISMPKQVNSASTIVQADVDTQFNIVFFVKVDLHELLRLGNIDLRPRNPNELEYSLAVGKKLLDANARTVMINETCSRKPLRMMLDRGKSIVYVFSSTGHNIDLGAYELTHESCK